MLPKLPKSGFWKFVKGSAKTLFVIEAVCFAGSYAIYYRMNTSREFRGYINENYPFVLDYYYQVGELIGNSNLREVDATVWRAQDRESIKNKPT